MSSPKRFWQKLAPALTILFLVGTAHGEVVLDGTLGPGGPLTGPDYAITSDLGKVLNTNLFHSFSALNIDQGETATFSGSPAIASIISRVTGGAPSTIDGLLRSTIPGASLYLVNPDGVLFGQGASLDITGSFHATTADYVDLGDLGRFDAKNPSASILTADPPSAFGFLTARPTAVTVADSGLYIGEGDSITIVAGEIQLSSDNSQPLLQSAGGNINLIAGGAGEVAVPVSGQSSSLIFPGDISLVGTGPVVSPQIHARDGGKIYIKGGRFLLDNAGIVTSATGALNGSDIVIESGEVLLSQGNLATLGRDSSAAGDINISANYLQATNGHVAISFTEGTGDAGDITFSSRESTVIERGSFITTTASLDGNSGDILIDSLGSVSIQEEANITTGTFGNGLSGKISIQGDVITVQDQAFITTSTFDTGAAGDISLVGVSIAVQNGAYLTASTQGDGDAGSIQVDGSDSVVIRDGAFISTGTYGSGLAGDITVTGGTIEISNTGHPLGSPYLTTSTYGAGDAGDISIESPGAVSILGGSYVSTETLGEGDAGNIEINSGSFTLGGSSYVVTRAGIGSVGNAGDILIEAKDQVRISEVASAESKTFGLGSAGNITIVAGRFSLTDNASVTSTTSDAGNAGNILIDADMISLDGFSTITSSTVFGSTGQAGDITIQAADQLAFADDARAESTTSGRGNAGNITIITDRFSITGNTFVTSTTSNAGDAGKILIDAGSVSLDSLGTITSSAEIGSSGNAGDISIKATGEVAFADISSAESTTSGPGSAGNISITGSQLSVTEDAYVTTSTRDTGDAGSIAISGDTISLRDSAYISSSTYAEGNAGNIAIEAGSATFEGSIYVVTNTSSASSGQAGDITITATEQVLFTDFASAESKTSGLGDAGTISIFCDSFTLLDGSFVSTSTYESFGDAGNITLNVSDSVLLDDNSHLESQSKSFGHAGAVYVDSRTLQVNDNARITTNSEGMGKGRGGDIVITTTDSIHVDGGRIESGSSSGGSGGLISVSGNSLTIANGGSLSADSTGSGAAGSISAVLTDTLEVQSNSRISTSTEDAEGGNIDLAAGELQHLRDSSITTSVRSGSGNGGNIRLQGGAIVLDHSQIAADAFGGNGGNILIKADPLIKDLASTITASSRLGLQGSIGIDSPVVDVGGALAVLPEGVLTDDLAPRECVVDVADTSSFVVRDIGQSRPRKAFGLSF